MAMTTRPNDERMVVVRFTKGTCYDGVDYGPEHLDIDVPLPKHVADEYMYQGRIRLRPEIRPPEPESELPPVREPVEAPPAPPTAKLEPKPKPATRRTRRRTNK